MSGTLKKYFVTGVGLSDKDDPKFPMRQVYLAADVEQVLREMIPFLEKYIQDAQRWHFGVVEATRLLKRLR